MDVSEQRRTNRYVRALVWFAVVLAVVVGLAVLAVQIVVWDGRVPRRLVEEGIEEQTGLHTSIRRVTTGWFGETVLEDVTLRVPLDDEPLARVPRVRVSHADLLLLILGRPLAIEDADLERAAVLIREDADGVWNVERAAALIGAAQARGEPGTGRVSLPGIDLSKAVVEVQRANGRGVTLPVNFTADADRGASWNFELAVGGHLAAKGRLSPGGDWLHEIAFDIDDVGAVLGLWMEEVPSPVRAEGTWRGRSMGERYVGTARLASLEIGGERARGVVRLETAGAEGSGVSLHPAGLEVSSDELPGGTLLLRDGDFALRGDTVDAVGVLAEWGGVAVWLDGTWDTGQDQGRVDATWSGGVTGMDLELRGTLAAAAQLSRKGRRQIEVELTAAGKGLIGTWDVAIEGSAAGDSLEHLEAAIAAPTLRWTDEQGTIDLSGLRLEAAGNERAIRLTSLVAPQMVVETARGAVDLETLEWAAEIDVRDWEAPVSGAGEIALALVAAGDAESAVVERARVMVHGVEVTGHGRYDKAEESSLSAEIRAVIPAWNGGGADEGGAATLASAAWGVEAAISGSVEPMDLRAQGTIAGEGLTLGERDLGPVKATWHGGYDGNIAWARTDAFELLRAMWTVRGTLGGDDRVGSIDLTVAELPMDLVAALAGAPVDVTGALTAEVEVIAPAWDPEQLIMSGEWAVERSTASRYGVDRGRGKIQTRRGRVDFTDILLELGEGQVSGTVGFNLNRVQELEVDLVSRGWPVQIEGTQIGVLLDSTAELTVNVAEAWVEGEMQLEAPLLIEGERYAELDAAVRWNRREIDVNLDSATIAGGFVSGTATVPLDALLESRADLWWSGVNLAGAVRPWTSVEGLLGSLQGRLTVGPSERERAPEPLRVVFSLAPEGVSWRGTTLGNVVLDSYIGENRVVLEESQLSIAGGRIDLWGRLTRHEDEPFAHVQTTFNDVEIPGLLRMANPELGDVQGRLTGRLSFGAYLQEPHRAFGSGRLTIEQAELANLPVISQLYGLLSLQLGGGTPTGEGTIDLALEEEALVIRRMQYFNRGTEVVGGARLDDVLLGGESPIRGYAVGRVRPLRDLGLPFMRQVDDILAAVQSGAASVRIGGTAGNLEIRPAPLRELGGFLRGLFGE